MNREKELLLAKKVARDLFWKIFKDADVDYIGELVKDMTDEELAILDLQRENKL